MEIDAAGQRRRRGRRLAAGAVGALGLVGLAGCSASLTTTRQLDTGKAEQLIQDFLKGKVEDPAVVGAVSCPEREVKQGDVMECTAQMDGQALRIRVTQDDDQGNISAEMAQAVLDMKQAVAHVEQEVAKAKRTTVTADCGPQRYLVRDPGATFDCRATPRSGRSASRVVVTVKDVEGNVELRLV